MRYYIAGPMAGYPGRNFDAFEYAAYLMRSMGYDVLPAHEIDHGETNENRGWKSSHEYLREDFRHLLECDAIVLLRGWFESEGARGEVNVAHALKMPIYYFDEHSGALVDMNRQRSQA